MTCIIAIICVLSNLSSLLIGFLIRKEMPPRIVNALGVYHFFLRPLDIHNPTWMDHVSAPMIRVRIMDEAGGGHVGQYGLRWETHSLGERAGRSVADLLFSSPFPSLRA